MQDVNFGSFCCWIRIWVSDIVNDFRAWTIVFHSVFYMAGPVYTAEISPKHIRGTLTSLIGITIGMGIVTGYVTNILLFDKSYGWRVSRLIDCVISCVFNVGMILMPMSPRYMYLCLLGINVPS